MNRHRHIDDRSLWFGRAIAARLADDPSLVEKARATLERWWVTSSPGVRPALEEWRQALDGPPQAIIALLTGTDERATRLRQSNPFAGVLTPQERNAIIRRFQPHDATPA